VLANTVLALVGFGASVAGSLKASPAKADNNQDNTFEVAPDVPLVTVFGDVKKKYVIEKLEDGKVVGRRRGVSVEVCSDVLSGRQAEYARTVPFGERPFLNNKAVCQQAQETELEKDKLDRVCEKPCAQVCKKAVERFVSEEGQQLFLATGFDVDSLKNKFIKKCRRACKNKCNPRYRAEPEDFFEVALTPN